MMLSAATIFKLRRATKHLDNTGIYRMGSYPLLPIIFILNYLFVAVSIFLDKPGTALLGMSVGQHIDWPAPGGKMIKLTLLAIEYQPEAAGDPF